MNIRFLCFSLLLMLMVTTSCSNIRIDKEEELPGIDVQLSEMNTKIGIEIYPGMPDVFHHEEDLTLLIKNHSPNTIVFPQDFGVKIFVRQGTEWQTIANNWGYPEGTNILPPDAVDPSGLLFFVYPDMSGTSNPAFVRIVVIGKVEGDGNKVGAFIDIQYRP